MKKQNESNVDMDVLIISCLLHDIGREDQFQNPELCHAQVSEPLYSVEKNRYVLDGTYDKDPSFFQEYKYKLEKLYDKFYTEKGSQLAKERQHSAIAFYSSMLKEVQECYLKGITELETILN